MNTERSEAGLLSICKIERVMVYDKAVHHSNKRIPHLMHNLIPKPASSVTSAGGFILSRTTKIIASSAEAETFVIGKLLANYIEQHTEFKLTVVDEDQGSGDYSTPIK